VSHFIFTIAGSSYSISKGTCSASPKPAFVLIFSRRYTLPEVSFYVIHALLVPLLTRKGFLG
jgi:hypothetical protein